jgi:methionine biosynthesis protein MetW
LSLCDGFDGPAGTPLRPDLAIIADLIPGGVRLLDLGCSDGALLDCLVRCKGVKGRGIELSELGVLACVRRGLSVRQGDLREGLLDYPAGSFDYVVLSQTLPYLDDPQRILGEVLRVGRRAIVSVPNWGYWRCRLELLVRGRIPMAPDLPQPWYQEPRWQALTVSDFTHFCRQSGIGIRREIYLSADLQKPVRRLSNLLATTAIFELERAQGRSTSGPSPSGHGPIGTA